MTDLETAITLQMQRDYYRAHADKLAEALRQMIQQPNSHTARHIAIAELAAYEAAQ